MTYDFYGFVQKISSFIKRKILRVNRERWNHQYAQGKWEGLKSETEHERFMATVKLLAKWKPNADILEIGCGEAILQQKLEGVPYSSLTGVDLSDVAIARAQVFTNERTRYVAANMEHYHPDNQYDTIIFTESLNYASNPKELLKRYQSYLKKDGVFIVSMYNSKHIPPIWQAIETQFQVLDSIRTTNQRGSWDCKVLQ